MKQPKKFDYYDFGPLLSHNATFNFCVGGRGLGKTYGAKKYAIKRAIYRSEQFVYLRRFKSELAYRTEFFMDVGQEFPDYYFRTIGTQAQMVHKDVVPGGGHPDEAPKGEKVPWRTIGFFFALSNAQSRKSIALPRVTTIIFDEFIIEKGLLNYLPDETNVFNNFYSTVDRWQDKTKVFFLANSVSIMNPYFIDYDIEPNSEFVKRGDGFIAVHFASAAKFASQVLQTKFGKFISGTEYADYAVGSVFADNNEFLVARKSSEAAYMATIQTEKTEFSVWVDHKSSPFVYYIQVGRPKNETIWTLDPNKMERGKLLLTNQHPMLQRMRAAFKQGFVLFDGAKSRNSFIPIFKK